MRFYLLFALALFALSCTTNNEQQAVSEPLNKDLLTSNKSLTNTTKSPLAKLKSLEFGEVKLTEGFWAERVKTCIETMIPEMWNIYSDAEVSHALENFKIAAGKTDGTHAGAPFHDGDFYKLIEAASMAYALTGDSKYDQMIDDVIPLIRESQRADGYIHTPVMIQTRNDPSSAQEFRDRMDFESYNMGHLMTAATVHYKATGKTDLLEIAKKAADYLYMYTEKFPEKMAQNAICPSHYMGVVEMYRTTGEPKYLDLAKKFIDIRSLMKDGTDHNQDRIPFREQTKAIGHAVRANYLYAGVADVYLETGDMSLNTTLETIWNDLVNTKLYITGGCGALYDGVSPNGTSYQPTEIQQVHQAYGREYELPNAGAHNETCANIGNVLWNWRMLQASGNAVYADMIEKTLFNSVLSGVNLNGKGYFYTNPLSHQQKLPFQLRWPNVREEYISYSNCCPPNTIRTIAEVPGYLYSKTDSEIFFNMYASSEVNTKLGGDDFSFKQTTDYPWSGRVEIEITKASGAKKTLLFRIPEWNTTAKIYINGEETSNISQSGFYASVGLDWQTGDKIVFEMEMPAKLIAANPLVENTQNKVAITRGPLVYCVEAIDLDEGLNVDDLIIPANIDLKIADKNIADTKLVSLKGKANLATSNWDKKLYQELNRSKKEIEIELIPYFAWANRAESDMSVWLPVSR